MKVVHLVTSCANISTIIVLIGVSTFVNLGHEIIGKTTRINLVQIMSLHPIPYSLLFKVSHCWAVFTHITVYVNCTCTSIGLVLKLTEAPVLVRGNFTKTRNKSSLVSGFCCLLAKVGIEHLLVLGTTCECSAHSNDCNSCHQILFHFTNF